MVKPLGHVKRVLRNVLAVLVVFCTINDFGSLQEVPGTADQHSGDGNGCVASSTPQSTSSVSKSAAGSDGTASVISETPPSSSLSSTDGSSQSITQIFRDGVPVSKVL